MRSAGLRRIASVRSLLKYSSEPIINVLMKRKRMALHPDFYGSSKLRLLLGCYEHETVMVSKSLLSPGMNVLDIGAHNGYYSRLFSEVVGPDGRVWAFEPLPENYQLLCQNIKFSKYQNVIPVQKAIFNKVGQVEFFEMASSGQHSIFDVSKYLSYFTFGRETFVESTTIDVFLAEQGNPEINLIKMDIEGAEPTALAGMSQTIARSKNLAMIVEFSPGALEAGGVEPSEFLQQLYAKGFKVWTIELSGKLTAMDKIDQSVYSVMPEVNLLCLKGNVGDLRR